MNPTRMKRNGAAKIDWAEIHRRLELARDAMETMADADPGSREKILRERAASLARATLPAGPIVSPEQSIEVIEFASAGERYAFETAYVSHVCPVGAITSIPGTPNFVVGIVASKGDVLSVIDLRSFLQLPLSGLSEPTAIIVLQDAAMEFGVIAEEILGIKRYATDSVEHELSTLAGTENTYLKGVAPGRTAILDASQMLSDPRLVVEIS